MNLGPRSVDLTGFRSGKLTAIEPVKKGENGSVIWRCRCDCGGEALVEASKILHQKTRSCGCLKGKKRQNLEGRRFGKLTVIRRSEEKNPKAQLQREKGRKTCFWECRCDCGKSRIVSSEDLLSGKVQDCGCKSATKRQRASKDISGQHFGKLTVLAATSERRNGSVLWECQCECGNLILVPCNLLTSGKVRSCGCLKHDNHQAFDHLNYVEDTCIESIRDQKLRKDNTSGHTGVNRFRNKWKASITFQKKTHYLGTFETYDDAVKARMEAEEKYFGAFLSNYYRNLESTEN